MSASSDNNLNHFFNIIAHNPKARAAFHSIGIAHVKNELDSHNSKFVVLTSEDPINTTAESAEDDTDVEVSDSESEIDQLTGYFGIGFHLSPLFGTVNYAAGKGSSGKGVPKARNVDILLAPPRNKLARGMGKQHFFLVMHPKSGVWMIAAMEDLKIGTDIRVSKGSKHAISTPVTHVTVNGAEYRIESTIDTHEKEIEYVKQRNAVLIRAGLPIPNTCISGIPFDSDIRLKQTVFRHGIGGGSSSRVYEGFDRESGDLRCIKAILIPDEDRYGLIQAEWENLDVLAGSEGIVHMISHQNLSQESEKERTTWPQTEYLVFEKGVSWDRHVFNNDNVDWEQRLTWFYQLLLGSNAIHSRGWIHRDVKPSNMLLIPGDNETKAVICDVGVLLKQPVSDEWQVCDTCYVAPEVVEQQDYDARADIFNLGIAIIQHFFPDAWAVGDFSTTQGLAAIHKYLDNPKRHPLPACNLLRGMTQQEQDDRFTTKDCLDHPVFNNVKEILAARKRSTEATAAPAKRRAASPGKQNDGPESSLAASRKSPKGPSLDRSPS